MTRPVPEPVFAEQVLEKARAVVARARFPFLATADGDQPRLRPVSPVRTEGFTVYFANLRAYSKTAEIAANPKVELGYMDDRHDQVRITGTAEVVTDRALLQEIWDSNPLLRQYLGSLDNPELIVYRVWPLRVRYMQEWALQYFECRSRTHSHQATSTRFPAYFTSLRALVGRTTTSNVRSARAPAAERGSGSITRQPLASSQLIRVHAPWPRR
jgi:general stress protein 26